MYWQSNILDGHGQQGSVPVERSGLRDKQRAPIFKVSFMHIEQVTLLHKRHVATICVYFRVNESPCMTSISNLFYAIQLGFG